MLSRSKAPARSTSTVSCQPIYRLDLVRQAALLGAGRQGGRGGLLGHPRSHGEIEHACDLARRLYHRERAVLLEPRDKGMVLWTLRYGDEVRDKAEYFKGIKGKPDPKEKKLLSSLIGEHT